MPKRAHILAPWLIWSAVLIWHFTAGASAQAADPRVQSSSTDKNGFNLIVISLSNVGAEHMSLYGYGRTTTPVLDRWAKDAIVFENAYSNASWTLPVAASLFTSLEPYAHGLTSRMRQNYLNKDIATLPEILRAQGYATAAFTGGLDYDPIFGHMRGFDLVAKNPKFTHFPVTLWQARHWLAANSSKPFFLFVHGYDTHCPFVPSPKFMGAFGNPSPKGVQVASNPPRCVRGYQSSENTYDAEFVQGENRRGKSNYKLEKVSLTQRDMRYMEDRYDETVLQVDDLVGGFLNSLDQDLLRRTVIVVFSDHGEMFGKHGRFGRAGIIRGTLYDDVLHIPLLIRLPGEMHRRVQGLVEVVDIMPSVLDILRIHVPAKIQGHNMVPLVRGTGVGREYAYAGLPFYRWYSDASYDLDTVAESIRNQRWKLVRETYFSTSTVAQIPVRVGEKTELYDLLKDPQELHNLTDAHPEIVGELEGKLEAWVRQSKQFVSEPPQTVKIPKNMIWAAREHGYWQ